MFTSRNTDVPAEGLMKPVMQLTTVVLPEPLGPMMPIISPGVHFETDIVKGLDAAK
jgi:hypothetical protein